MTEADIQDTLYFVRQQDRHEAIVPNCGMVFGWEADLVSVTKAGLTHEHEIKISRSDFKADARKQSKHVLLLERRARSPSGFVQIPSYFWYVTPPDLLDGLEVPEYAGHMTVAGRYSVKIRKQAPRLHREKITESQLQAITRGLMYRYWKRRLARGKAVAS